METKDDLQALEMSFTRISESDSELEMQKSSAKVVKSAVTHLLCGLYAMIVVVIGVVFPVTSALTSHVTKNYVWIFHLYLYGVSLVFLLYLHIFLLRHKRYPSDKKGNNIQDISIVHASNKQLDGSNKFPNTDYLNDVDRIEKNTNEHDEKSPELSDIDSSINDNQEIPSVTQDAEGVNFYLRLGAIAFAIGSMILDGFSVAEFFEDQVVVFQCRHVMAVVAALVHVGFVFFQTFFLFKSHRIVIHMHKALVRFGFMHLVATNICMWSHITISETSDSLRGESIRSHGSGHVTEHPGSVQHHLAHDVITTTPTIHSPINMTSEHFSTSTDHHLTYVECHHASTIANLAAPYLFPCVIEYSLIAAAMAYKMYLSVGKQATRSINLTSSYEYNNNGPDCHKANKGLFFGLFVMVVTLISVSCFFIFDKRGGDSGATANLIFYVTEIVLLTMSSIIVILGFLRFQQLSFFPDNNEESFDSHLLLVAFCGVATLNVFILLSSIVNMSVYGLPAILSLVVASITLIEAIMQTIFILDGLKRAAGNMQHVSNKPGRALITFLLLCNFSLWVINTFEVKTADNIPMHPHFFGELAWSIITHGCIPLIIFYRFHATVCLSDIWINAYIMKTKDL